MASRALHPNAVGAVPAVCSTTTIHTKAGCLIVQHVADSAVARTAAGLTRIAVSTSCASGDEGVDAISAGGARSAEAIASVAITACGTTAGGAGRGALACKTSLKQMHKACDGGTDGIMKPRVPRGKEVGHCFDNGSRLSKAGTESSGQPPTRRFRRSLSDSCTRGSSIDHPQSCSDPLDTEA